MYINTAQIQRISKYEYLITFILIVMCGFTSGDAIPGKSYFLSFMFLLYIVKKRNRQSIKPLLLLVSGYWIIGLVHWIEYNYFSSRCFVVIPMLMMSGYYVMDRLGEKFKYAYMNIMTVIAAISLFFYVIMILTGYVPNISFFEKTIYKSIFIFNMRLGEIANHRNCGPFWEPGAFAGYLLMVGLMFFNQLDRLWQVHRRKCVILLLALFSTFSTQGYIAFGLLILLFYLRSHFNIKIILSIICFIAVAVLAYIKLDFLKEKVDEQIELSEDWESDESLQSANRFSTSLLDIYYIEKSPLYGNTDNVEIRYSDHPFVLRVIDYNGGYGSGSGTTSVIAMYGIPLFILWLYFVFLGFRRSFTIKESIFMLFFILILGSAEFYNDYIYYLSLPFLYLGKKINL